MRVGWLAVVAALAGGGVFVPLPVAAAETLTLKSEAGLGGVARPGRWVPVRVSIENNGEDLSGEIVVEWGTALVHRRVMLTGPSRSQFDVYIRTPDPRDVMTVRLRSHGADVRTVDVPIHVAAPDAEVTLCVVSADSLASDAGECTASMTPESLPRSMRGYDAADRLVWGAGPESVLAADQRTALSRWRGYRLLSDSGALSLAPRLLPPATGFGGPQRSLSVVAGVIGVYVVLIVAAGSIARAPRSRPLSAYAAIGLLAVLGSSVGLAAGRVGPASVIVVRHTSTVQQLPGGGAVVAMRGVAEYPAFSAFQIHAAGTESTVETPSASRSEQWFDENGYPYIAGVFGLGSSQPFALEGVVGLSWLKIERRGAAVRVTNVSPVPLSDCRFPEGFSVQRVGTLGAGQTIEAQAGQTVDTPFFVCTLQKSPIDFTDARYMVEVDGASLVAAHIPSGIPDAAGTR